MLSIVVLSSICVCFGISPVRSHVVFWLGLVWTREIFDRSLYLLYRFDRDLFLSKAYAQVLKLVIFYIAAFRKNCEDLDWLVLVRSCRFESLGILWLLR